MYKVEEHNFVDRMHIVFVAVCFVSSMVSFLFFMLFFWQSCVYISGAQTCDAVCFSCAACLFSFSSHSAFVFSTHLALNGIALHMCIKEPPPCKSSTHQKCTHKYTARSTVHPMSHNPSTPFPLKSTSRQY